MRKQDQTLKEFRISLAQEGKNTFCFEEAQKAHGGEIMATRKVLYRLVKTKELFSPRKDFFVIIPPEYQNVGSVPALWFIDAYMQETKSPYYVGLLSSAALLGAAHQQPHEKIIKPTYLADMDVLIAPWAAKYTQVEAMNFFEHISPLVSGEARRKERNVTE